MSSARAIVVLLLATLCVGPVGCKKPDKAGASDEAAGGEAAPAPASKVSDAEKTNAYIGCSNRFVSRAYQARERYLSWADAKKGPTGKEKIVFGTYTLVGDLDRECRAPIDHVATAEPRMPELEQAGEALVVALEALAPLLEDAVDYYGQGKAYKEDKLAHGKELHPKLMAAFEAFEAADHAMGVQLDAIEDHNLETRLASLQGQADRVPYLLTKTILTGKQLVRLVSGVDKIEAVDLAAFVPAVDAFEAVVVELVEWTKSHKVDGDVTSFARGPAPKVAFSSRALIQHVTSKAKWSSGDKMMIENGNPQMAEGHPASVVEAYNGMIAASNRL